MILSKRLEAAAKFIKGFNYLADCGTDHGYLPIYCVEQSYVKKAIASDNKIKPLNGAAQHISEAGLTLEIMTVLADGLTYLTEDIDVVSMTGLGGMLMIEIIEEANLENVKRLVLSPNSDAKAVRAYLTSNGFKIIDELMIEDHRKIYPVIACEPGQMTLSDVELEFGPFIIKRQSPTFVKYIKKLITQLKHAYPNIKDKEDVIKIKKRIELLEEVIS